MSSANEFQTIDDFLKHSGREGGGKRLKNWKNDGQITVWLHMKQLPIALWIHRVPELVIRPNKDDPSQPPKRNVWGREHVCYEDEKILKKQRYRNPDGSREHAPKFCGICKMIECVRMAIVNGQLADTDPVFKFDGSDKPEENMIVHAGALCGYWPKKELEKEEVKARLGKAGVNLREIFKENMLAGLNYLFAVVSNDAISDGLQIALQPQSVGEKVRKVINDELASKPGDLGNPTKHPYAIQILYDKAIPAFDKYSARRIDKHALTEPIREIIGGDKPDLSKYTKPFNVKAVRTSLETHALVDLPWDQLFVEVPVEEKTAPPQPEMGPRKTISLPGAPPSAAPSAPVEELGEPCECGAPMTKTQTKCGKCGAEYAIQPDAPAQAAPASAASSHEEEDGNAFNDADVPF